MRFLFTTCCLVLITLASWAQTRKITGQIIGADKEPIIGAAVLQKGTTTGTTTDIDGNFTMDVPEGQDVTLVVSYVGMKTQEVPVGTQSNINLTLEEDVKVTEEVVVVGYGTIKKSDLTGSISSLKPGDVKQVPSGDVRDAIQGKAAGVDIVRTSGETGKNPQINIRGSRSVVASNEPLYIVDGVQYSSLQDINPNDIQSMEVLKDASSTAIYGSRGANGVIIVTTKKGAAGDIKVTLNSYLGVSTVSNWGLFQGPAFPKAMDAEQFAQLKREASRPGNNNNYQPDIIALGNSYENYLAGKNTDYVGELLHNGLQRDIQLGLSGGTDKLKTYFSLDYFDEYGLLRNDNLKRYTGRLNLDYNINKFLKVGTQTQITYYDQNKRQNPIGNALKIDPTTSPFDNNGILLDRPNEAHANPLADEQPNRAVDRIKTLRVFPTIYGEITFFKGLTARTNIAINYDTRSEGIFFAGNSYSVLNRNRNISEASHNTNNRVQINWQGILNYNTTIAEKHSIGATLISEVLTNRREQFYSQAFGQTLTDNLYYNMGEVLTGPISSRFVKSSLVSFAGRANYSYKGKYLIQATGRWDGASQLPEGNKWDFFPSISAGWRIIDESFMEFAKGTFSTIKLRGSWGIAGNAAIRPYSTQSNLASVQYGYNDTRSTAYIFSPVVGNKAAKWEKSTTVDIGLDLGIWKERVTIGFDYYQTKTTDLLLNQRLPYTTGFSETVANVGKSQNIGQELTVSSVNIQKKNFTWSSTLTFMRNREKVTELFSGANYTQVQVYDTDGDPSGTRDIIVGAPGNRSYYDYEKVGIWQENERDQAAVYGAIPGNIKIKDQNGDGKISPEDRVAAASTVPRWSGGFSSDFKFYNFDLNIYIFARMGQTINYQYQYNQAGTENSIETREYWTPENPTNDLPRPGLAINPLFNNTINYVDGSFVKLRNLTLGYTLPTVLTQKVRISRVRFYATAKNLFIFTKQKNYDTELEGQITFPSTTLYVFGANLEF